MKTLEAEDQGTDWLLNSSFLDMIGNLGMWGRTVKRGEQKGKEGEHGDEYPQIPEGLLWTRISYLKYLDCDMQYTSTFCKVMSVVYKDVIYSFCLYRCLRSVFVWERKHLDMCLKEECEYMCLYVCVCECMCPREKDGDGERWACVSIRVCAYMCVSVCMREWTFVRKRNVVSVCVHLCVCVCECMWERENMRLRERRVYVCDRAHTRGS